MKYVEKLWAIRTKNGLWMSEFGGQCRKLRKELLSERCRDFVLGDGDRAVRVTATYEVEGTP